MDIQWTFSNRQDLTTTPGTTVSTNVVDLRNSSPAAITTNPNSSSINLQFPATAQKPYQLLLGKQMTIELISGQTAAGTGTGTLTVNFQLSTDNSSWDTIGTVGAIPLFSGATTQRFRVGDRILAVFAGLDKNSSGTTYKYARLSYTTAATTITTSTIITAIAILE